MSQNYAPTPVPRGVSAPRRKVARGTYDFAVDGGAVGTFDLLGATDIPSGAVILGGYVIVGTQLTSSGSATIAVHVESAGDIVPATAVASWTTGLKGIVPALTSDAVLGASDGILTTAARTITATVAVEALTAGVFDVLLEYIDPLAS